MTWQREDEPLRRTIVPNDGAENTTDRAHLQRLKGRDLREKKKREIQLRKVKTNTSGENNHK